MNAIDQLAQVRAQIAALQVAEKRLAEEVKALGVGSHAGNEFLALVIEVEARQSLDAKAAEAKLKELGVSHQWFAAHQKITAGYKQVKLQKPVVEAVIGGAP